MRRHTTTRRGKTLVEALVIITLLGLVLSGSATTLITLFRVERQIGRDAEARSRMARLASRFRADVHAATACEADHECRLTMPDGDTIRYAAKEGWLWRERLAGETIEHRDAYPLASGSTVNFEMQPLGTREAVRLSIAPAASSPTTKPQPQPTIVMAVIDLHSRRAVGNALRGVPAGGNALRGVPAASEEGRP